MTKLKVKLLAHPGAPDSVFVDGMKRLEVLFPAEEIKYVENKPNVLFFLTGGSEREALKFVNRGFFSILIGSKEHNSYASASEVKAYLNSKGYVSVLVDEEESETSTLLKDFLQIKIAIKALKNQKLALIGQVSDWLISSTIPADILKDKLGIDFVHIPWPELPHYSTIPESKDFNSYYTQTGKFNLSDTSKVSQLISDVISKRKLDAITVECFSLVQKNAVTACLPLAKFNADGIPAGCEGDIVSITGMMIGKQLTGIVPWIANTNKVTNEKCLFSHCTIAPSLVKNYTVETHFETGLGTAIQGDFIADTITIFRTDNLLSKAFIATANIIGRPKSETACRTQIEVKLSEKEVKLLREQPLGNHHLIFPGDVKHRLSLFCKVMGIELMNHA